MSNFIIEERNSINSELNESTDSQNVIGSYKEGQNRLEKEEELSKEDLFEFFREDGNRNKMKKKVSFADEKNFVTIIELECYKKYNTPIQIGKKNLKKKYADSLVKKREKEERKKKEAFNDFLDKEGDSGKSCSIF